MKDKDQIQELFSKKLENHEVNVRPELWNGIASQLTTGVSATAGVSLFSKIIFSIVTVAIVSTAIIVLNNKKEKKSDKVTQKIETQNSSKEINGIKEVLKTEEVKNKESKASVVSQKTQKQDKKSTDSNSKKKEKTDFISSFNDEASSNPTQKGVLKERKEESVNNEVLAKEEPSNEDPQKENISKTTFPVNIDKEQLVEHYSISKLPDVFSPNNDGNNDYLFIQSEGIIDFSIVIMNTKSETVFTSTDSNFKWDGIDKYGNPVPEGKYIYFITGSDKNGNPVKKYQSLTIVR